MAQRVETPGPGTGQTAGGEPWVPVVIEHYNNSLMPWVSAAGKAGRAWLEARTRPSADAGVVLVAPEVYQLWKPHATGAGGPFPKEILRRRDQEASAPPRSGDTPGWRATLVLGGLLMVSVLIIVVLVSLRH